MSSRLPGYPDRRSSGRGPVSVPASAAAVSSANSAAARRLNRLSKGPGAAGGPLLDDDARAALDSGSQSKTIVINRSSDAKRMSGRKQIQLNNSTPSPSAGTLPRIRASNSEDSSSSVKLATPRSPVGQAPAAALPPVNTAAAVGSSDSKPHPHINFTFRSRTNSIDRSSAGSSSVQSQAQNPAVAASSLAIANPPFSPSAADSIDFYGSSMAGASEPSPSHSARPPFEGLDEAEFEDLDEQVLRSPTFREMHRLIRVCAAQPSCDKMVITIERQARSIVGASALRLFLVQRDGMVHYSRPQPFPLNGGIAGYTRTRREIVNLTNPVTDERYLADVDQLPDRSPASAYMCIAVEADSKADGSGPRDVVAVLQCFKDREGESFSTRDCKVMYRLSEFIGNMLRSSRSADRAQALYNASLQSHKRSAALLDVAKALASETGLDRIVSIIVSQVPELLDSDRCTLFFVDRQREELIVTKGASKGRHKNLVSWIFGQCNAPELPFPKGQNEIRLPMRNGVAGHVATTGETVNIIDAHQDPRFNSAMDKETGYRTRSVLCVPMIDSAGVIIGVVQAINKNPLYGRFDQQDETLLKTFSAQAALAVRNSQLFQKTNVALQQSDALLEVTKALSQELKIEALISIICSKVQSLLNAERCTVFIVDKERKELYTSEHMSYGMGPSLPIDHEKTKLIYFPMNRGIVGSVATSGASVNIPDAYEDERFNKAMDKETGYRTRSILCTAIKNHRNEIVAAVQVINKRDGTFNEDDENLLSAFCAQAAVAIENSRLFQQTEKALNHALADQRNLKFMLSVTKNLFSDMHLTSMIDQMTMQVHALLKADDCQLYLVDDQKKEFWVAKDDSHGSEPQHRFAYGLGIAGTVAQTGETIRISSGAHADPRFNAQVDQRKGKVTHSILCCPIQADSPDGEARVVGVISVRDEKDRGGFEQEEEKLLKVFCAQAAVAIMNSKRFASIMEQSEFKESDHSAADYLKANRGMKLASDDIHSFQFTSDEIKLKGAIGTGSYGEVYRAMVKNQIVAVKKLHVRNLKAEQVDAFCKEASLMCQLDHPNIVGFIGAVTEPSNLCIITQFCIARDSLVSAAQGLSVRIQELIDNRKAGDQDATPHQVIAFAPSIGQGDSSHSPFGGLFSMPLSALTYNQCRPCVTLTFHDSSTLICTPDHRILTVDLSSDLPQLSWLPASDISIDSYIVGSIEFPEDRICTLERMWTGVTANQWQFNTAQRGQRERTLAFVRLLGYSVGCGRSDRGRSLLLANSEADVRSLQDDIERVCGPGVRPLPTPHRDSEGSLSFVLALPMSLHRAFRALFVQSRIDISPDDDASQRPFGLMLPEFLFSSSCPSSVIREYLGGLFGSEGAAPECLSDHGRLILSHRLLLSRGIDAASQAMWLRPTERFFSSICDLLSRIGLGGCSVETLPAASGSASVRLLQLTAGSTSFLDSLGFRHSALKQAQLSLAHRAWRLERWWAQERRRFILDVERHCAGGLSRERAIERARASRQLQDIPNMYGVFDIGQDESIDMLQSSPFDSISLSYSQFYPRLDAFLRSFGSVSSVLLSASAGSKSSDLCAGAGLPPVLLHLKHRSRASAPVPVYDLTVPNRVDRSFDSFTANGVVVHNCSRGSLADLLLEDKVDMNFRCKVKFALDAAMGMLYLHNSNPVILHRDLKSDNLLVTQHWRVKVADFGLTRFISEKKQMTQVGSPLWMAPEVIMGKKYTEKADVYAFGIILWEILTRLEPYEEKEPMQIVVEVVNDGLRPTIPADFAASPLIPLMKDCWNASPEQRPPFEKVVERLKHIYELIPADDNSSAGIPGTSKPKSHAKGMIYPDFNEPLPIQAIEHVDNE